MKQIKTKERLCYRPEDLCVVLGISRKAAYETVNREDFPAIRLNGGRRILIPIAGLEAWLERQAGGYNKTNDAI